MTLSISAVIKAALPLEYYLRRIFYLSLVRADLKDIDISLQCDGRIFLSGTKDIHVGRRCRMGRDTVLRTMECGHISLGSDIRINRGATLVSYSKISIGDYAIIGEFVSIRDANHGTSPEKPMRNQKHTTSPIDIGKDVWIGRGCCILPGVTIGKGSIIGANSVVTGDIPPYSIAAGIPAKVIKQRQT